MTTMFEKVRTRRVYMDIAEQIQQLIREGKLKPGDLLPPERILARQLGVSRPPLREALAVLEILGVVESRGGKGNIIKNSFDSISYREQFDELKEEESPFEILEARKAVEAQIAALAAEKATKEDINAIRSSLEKMREAIRNIPQAMQADREFHINIARAAHNSILLSTMIYISEALKERLWVKLKKKRWNKPEHSQKTVQEHEAIFNAIEERNSKAAARKMYEHLADVEKDLLDE